MPQFGVTDTGVSLDLSRALRSMGRLAQAFTLLGELERPDPLVQQAAWTYTSPSTLSQVTLNHDVLVNIAQRLHAQDLAALGSACAQLAQLAACTYPGLRLSLYPHQRASLAFLLKCEASEQRGGILADEPGTGKTVTILALLGKCAALWTAPPPDLQQSQIEAAETQWKELGCIQHKRDIVYGILNAARRAVPDEYELFKRAAPTLPGYADVIGAPPPDFTAIAKDKAIGGFSTRGALDAALRAVPAAAKRYWSSEIAADSHPEGATAAAYLAQQASALASAIERAIGAQRPLANRPPPPLRSRATLLIVPRPLLPHWREQLEWHLEPGALPGPVLIDADERRAAGGSTRTTTTSTSSSSLRGVFSAEELANASVVVTTTERLSLEQRHAATSGQPSVLCGVHWARLVCDEGHFLGGGALTNCKVLLGALPAERRWILSGTPAKETSDADGCATLGGLLAFLRVPQRAEWPALARRFLKGSNGSAAEAAAAPADLVSFLRPLMVRQLKRKIRVPPPIRSTVLLDVSPPEQLAYNTIVSYIMANLKLTSMEGAETGAGAEVSLLHRDNLKPARDAIENIRQACNGGGKQICSLSAEYFDEARMWLTQRYKAPPEAVRRATHFMQCAQRGEALPCDKCGLPLLLQLVLPQCGHLVCPSCVPSDVEHCPVCEEQLPWVVYDKCVSCNDVACQHKGLLGVRKQVRVHPRDGFAWMQPGFDTHWQESLQESNARALADLFMSERRADAKAAGVPVARHSPSAASAASAASATSAGSSSASSPSGGGDSTSLTKPSAAYKGFTKAAYIVESVAALRRAERSAAEARANGRPYIPDEQSNYDGRPRLLNQLGHFLYLRFGDDAVAQFWGKWRSSELDKFRSGRVRFWRCKACPQRHDGSCADGREVEFPETKCYGRHLRISLHAQPGLELAEGASIMGSYNEEDVRVPGTQSFQTGTRWENFIGHHVETRLRRPDGSLSPWLVGTLHRFGRCNTKLDGADVQWSSRRIQCFVLLLTRDGSHGLDLSMLTHLYLADQCWDPAVEQQVIARAWRMGATGSCRVEQLLMRGTLEHSLHLNVAGQAAVAAAAGGGEVVEEEQQRTPSSKARGKQRMPPEDTPPAKRAREEPPAAAQPQGEVAKVHALLRAMRFVR